MMHLQTKHSLHAQSHCGEGLGHLPEGNCWPDLAAEEQLLPGLGLPLIPFVHTATVLCLTRGFLWF